MGGLLPITHPHMSGKEEDLIILLLEYIIDVQTWFFPLSGLKYLISGQSYSAFFFWNISIMICTQRRNGKEEKKAVLLSFYDSIIFFYFPTRCLSWTLYAWGRLGSGWFKVLGECSTCAMFNNVQQCSTMFNVCNVQQGSACAMFNMCNIQQCSMCAIFNNVQHLQRLTMFNNV